MARRWLVIPGCLALAGLVLVPGRVTAECGRLNPWPSFNSFAPRAELIVIGTVTSTEGDDSLGAIRFTLRLDEVLRGEVHPTPTNGSVTLHGPRSAPGWGLCDSALRVHVGDVIALASDGPLPSVEAQAAGLVPRPPRDDVPPRLPSQPLSPDGEAPGQAWTPPSYPQLAAAFMRGETDRFLMPGVRRMSIERVRALALPDTAVARLSEPSGTGPWLPLIAAGVASLAVIAFDRRRRLELEHLPQ